MPKPAEPVIREQLLEKCLAICVQAGFRDLSLRALALEVGTTHRRLIYHFGSAEKLFWSVVEEFRRRQVASLEQEFTKVTTWQEFTTAAKSFWSQLAQEGNRHITRTSFEIQLDAIHQSQTQTGSAYPQTGSEHWIAPLSRAMSRLGKDESESRLLARMIAGCGKGLLLDLLAAESDVDRAEIQAAFDRLIDSL